MALPSKRKRKTPTKSAKGQRGVARVSVGPRTGLSATIFTARAKSMDQSPDALRAVLADYVKWLGGEKRKGPSEPKTFKIPGDLPPRQRQTLERLMAGDSEKEAARRLGISIHTLHVYVKSLYKRFEVSSKGELMAKLHGYAED
jgi:DNA-binding CsgD family transcriptional regulator